MREIDVYVVFNSDYFEVDGVYTSYDDAADYVIEYLEEVYDRDLEEKVNRDNLSRILDELSPNIEIFSSKLYVNPVEFKP